MSPIRRYLRITKYSVLEVRIYLEKPSDAAWLLSSRDSVLARALEEVRPLVLPKLREEDENAKRKSSKKQRGIKDVVTAEDFEVTIFLTELSTRHSLLTKHKHFSDKPQLKSTGNKLTGWLNNNENPISIDEDEHAPEILQEEEDEPELNEIPEVQSSKRKPNQTADDEVALFVSSDDEDFFTTQRDRPTQKRRKRNPLPSEQEPTPEPDPKQAQDDKKKLAMNTSYDGFSIYGRILCLLVKRKGKRNQAASVAVGGSQMMEEWVSTQAALDVGFEEEEDG